MTTKKTPIVKEQGFSEFYIATMWNEEHPKEQFQDYVSFTGKTVEEAVNSFREEEGMTPKYVYVVTKQLKAVTTYN
jgi:hypothetical protein